MKPFRQHDKVYQIYTEPRTREAKIIGDGVIRDNMFDVVLLGTPTTFNRTTGVSNSFACFKIIHKADATIDMVNRWKFKEL